jgi:Protein of unknown function (DUF3107)
MRGKSMEVRIGVVYSAKELNLDIEGTPDEVAAQVNAGLAASGTILWLTDSKGRRVGVPADKIAYIEIVGEDAAKRVGFGR